MQWNTPPGRSVHHALGAAPGYYAGYAGVGYGALSFFIVYSAHVVTPLCLYCGMAVRAHCKAGAEGYDDRGVRDGCSCVALGDYGVHHCVRAKSKRGAAGLVSQYGYISLGYYSLCGFGIWNKNAVMLSTFADTVIHGLGGKHTERRIALGFTRSVMTISMPARFKRTATPVARSPAPFISTSIKYPFDI